MAPILFLGFPALKAQGNWDCMLSVWPGPESLTAPKSEALASLHSQQGDFGSQWLSKSWLRSGSEAPRPQAPGCALGLSSDFAVGWDGS